LKYQDPSEVAEKYGRQLKDDGCDLVIALTHTGYPVDCEVAANTRSIDVVVGGHTHTVLDEMTIVKNLDGKDVKVVTNGKWGVSIARMAIDFQQNRLTASAINVPVGMKNPTSGDLSIMMNSITAAQSGHTFIYRGWEVESTGNPYAHAILRGGMNAQGQNIANYHYEDLMKVYDYYQSKDLKNMGVVIDTNHANSNKKFLEQIRISKDVMHSRRVNKDIRSLVKGLMIESYIVDGAQPASCGTYGQSITDPCLGWEKTEKLIYELAEEM
jgi:phospho-2-dehydro-3-deoxyheptonate aldolase